MAIKYKEYDMLILESELIQALHYFEYDKERSAFVWDVNKIF